MASDKETVAEIVGEMRTKNVEPNYDAIMRLYAYRIEAAHKREDDELKRKLETKDAWIDAVKKLFKKQLVEAAHDREVAELRECMKEAVDYFCGNDKLADCTEKVYGNPKCETEGQYCMVERWRKALEGATK